MIKARSICYALFVCIKKPQPGKLRGKGAFEIEFHMASVFILQMPFSLKVILTIHTFFLNKNMPIKLFLLLKIVEKNVF